MRRNNVDYFEIRQANAEHAQRIVQYMQDNHKEETAFSIENFALFPHFDVVPDPVTSRNKCGEIQVQKTTSVDALYQQAVPGKKVCILDFASYENPGGAFLTGAMAQEEALCHESNLYNIIASESVREMFYNKHLQFGGLNRSLYYSDLLYIPKVVFIQDNREFQADMIVCAAPNRREALSSKLISDQNILEVMRHRIDSVLYAASQMDVDILILGAFGCGVFGNDAGDVASIFLELFQGKYNRQFDKIIFPIPDNRNYSAMSSVFFRDKEKENIFKKFWRKIYKTV